MHIFKDAFVVLEWPAPPTPLKSHTAIVWLQPFTLLQLLGATYTLRFVLSVIDYACIGMASRISIP